MLDSKKFSSEKQLNMSETWNWANYDIHLNNNHNGNNVSSTLTPQWNSNLPAYIDQTTLNNSSINIINPTTMSTINNNVLNTTTTTTTTTTINTNTNLYKPAYSTKLYHTYQGDLEQNKCLNDFPNTNQIHLPSIESVRRLTHYDNNLNHIYNNELYSTCFYNNHNHNHNQHDHLHKSEYNLPQITYHNNEQYEIDLQKLPKTNYDDYFINHERNNTNHIDRIIDYFPIINTDTNYLVSSTPNSLIHLNQIDQYTLATCNEVKGNDNSSTIVHNNSNNNNNNNDNDNIINESKENSSLTIQQHLWDIKDLKLPKVNYYDSYELWPTGHCRRVYAQTCERARRHQSGWAMRNTNNHNPQVLKKSCLGVLECSMNCMVQGKPLSLRPAICDKARKKQCNRECITPGCKGRLILRNCRGHSGYPVTHFWRFANGAVYFEAKGEHDHNRPSLKTFGLTESDTVTTNTTTTNTINSHVTTTSNPTTVDKLVTGITTLISPDMDRNLNHITNNNNNIQYIHSQNLHLHDQLPQQQQQQQPQPQQGCHDYRFLPQYEQSIIDQQNFTLSNEFCNYYNYQSSNHSQLDNSHLLSLNKTKHVGKRVTNRKVIRREKKLTNTHLKKQQKCENYYKKLSNESNCTPGDIKRNRKIQQNTRSDQINKFKIPIKTNENDNDQIFCDDPFHSDTIHNCYAINITNNNSWNNETINQIDSSLNQSIEKEQYNTTEMNAMNHSYYSDPLFTTTTSSSSPSSVTITTVNQHHSSIPFWNCIQDLDSYLSNNHNSSNYMTNTMISTMYSSPNWSLSPSVLSSSSLSSSSTYSTCTTCALSLSSLSLCSTNVSTSLSKQILPDSIEVIQCNPLTESYHQITSTPNINCNESYFIQYNNCSYFDKSKNVSSSSSSYNEYPQSVFINSMYREHEESNPVQFNDNDINEEICHSTPQQPIYIDDYHYHYYYYYYYSNPCLSMSDQIVLNDPITTSSTITNSSISSVNNDINTTYSTKSVNNYSMESLSSNHRQHYHEQQEQQQQPTVQWSMNDMNDHRTEERLNESMEFMNQDEYDIEKSFNYYHFMLNSNVHQPINMNCSNESDKYGIVQGINDVHENVNENSLHEEEEEEEDDDDDDDDEEEGEEQVEDAHYNHPHPPPPPPPHHHNHQHQQQSDEFTFNQNLSEETTNWSNPYLQNSSLLPSSSSSSASSKEQISQFEPDLTIDNAKHHNFEECLPRTSNSSITITTTTTTANSNTTCSNNNNNNVSITDNSNDNDHSFPCEIHNYDNSFNYFIVNEPVSIATTDHLLISHSHF